MRAQAARYIIRLFHVPTPVVCVARGAMRIALFACSIDFAGYFGLLIVVILALMVAYLDDLGSHVFVSPIHDI